MLLQFWKCQTVWLFCLLVSCHIILQGFITLRLSNANQFESMRIPAKIKTSIFGQKSSKLAIVRLRHSLLDFAAFTQDSRLPTCQSGDSIILLLFLRLARLFLKAASPVSSANKYRQCQGYTLIDWLWHHFGLRPRISLTTRPPFKIWHFDCQVVLKWPSVMIYPC